MRRERFLVLLLALGLGACDERQTPPPAASAAASVVAPVGVPAAAALAAVPAEAVAAPVAPAAAVPAPVAAPATPPVAAVAAERAAPPRAQAVAAAPAARPQAERPRRAAPAPLRPLDLSLPHEHGKEFFVRRSGDEPLGEPQTLLPQLFVAKRKDEPANVAFAGRLITNQRVTPGKDYWDSVEGAEVQVQFRR